MTVDQLTASQALGRIVPELEKIALDPNRGFAWQRLAIELLIAIRNDGSLPSPAPFISMPAEPWKG